MTYNASTKTFSGTPTAPGSWTINGTASDGVLTVTDSFVVTVPNAPVIVANPIPNQTAPANGSAWSYTVPANTFSDANATTLTVSASGTWPTWLTFNTSTKTFSGTPSTVGTWTEFKGTEVIKRSLRARISAAPEPMLLNYLRPL